MKIVMQQINAVVRVREGGREKEGGERERERKRGGLDDAVSCYDYIASVKNKLVWSIGGMILTGETEVLVEKHYTASVVDE
jgi:hypothetical protein